MVHEIVNYHTLETKANMILNAIQEIMLECYSNDEPVKYGFFKSMLNEYSDAIVMAMTFEHLHKIMYETNAMFNEMMGNIEKFSEMDELEMFSLTLDIVEENVKNHKNYKKAYWDVQMALINQEIDLDKLGSKHDMEELELMWLCKHVAEEKGLSANPLKVISDKL